MLRSEFASQIVEALGSSYEGSEEFLVKWMTAENTTAEWNPLATTQPEPGDSHFNGVGVRNYPDEATGLRATVTTLRNGYYPHVVHFLTTGEHADTQALDHELQRWSGNGYTWQHVNSLTAHDTEVSGSGQSTGGKAVPAWYTRLLKVTTPFLHGADVEHVQDVTGVPEAHQDSKYGPETADHVKAFQSHHGLHVDGIVGPDTARAMG
jgi:peptidoglycan hydrolase-like protein with peptidoglycan-binding domain